MLLFIVRELATNMRNRFLVNTGGEPFTSAELLKLRGTLANLPEEERTQYRNDNATHLAENGADTLLVVSGPGTGKSLLFRLRILHWLTNQSSGTVLALSFVRKLVADLANDLQNDANLSTDQKGQVEVHTLHRFARSVLERNHGSTKSPLKPHCRIIGKWADLVWRDALIHSGHADNDSLSRKEFERQLHELSFNRALEWRDIFDSYAALCMFYNAVGFADLIVRATTALRENPALSEHQFFIVDEYQDFNQSEEDLMTVLMKNSPRLIVGDDDQVLYEKLKAGKPELIRSLYKDAGIANAMLPFCSRCDFHIVQTASHFINQNCEAEHIEKIFLPLRDAGLTPKVKIIGCASPKTAVDYIRQFAEEHKAEIEQRAKDLETGSEKDPFLLVLSPATDARFYGDESDTLRDIVAAYKAVKNKLSFDYFRVLAYFAAAADVSDNFALRKVLDYLETSYERVGEWITECIREKKNLCEIASPELTEVLVKLRMVKEVLDSTDSVHEKVNMLAKLLPISDPSRLETELAEQPIGRESEEAEAARDEEDAELEELGIQSMSAIELLTIQSAKGLSADHVIIVGFDDVNMKYVNRNAFYVALTRPRRTLHLLTALGARGSAAPHGFLGRLPEAHVDFHSYTKGLGTLKPLANEAAFREYLSRAGAARRRGTKRR